MGKIERLGEKRRNTATWPKILIFKNS